jgi:hypothetical protein
MQVNGAPVQALTEDQIVRFRMLVRELHDEPQNADIFPVDPMIEGLTIDTEGGTRIRIGREGRNKFIYDLIANARSLDGPGLTLNDELRRCISGNPENIEIDDVVRSKAQDLYTFVKDVVGPIIGNLSGTPQRRFKQSLWTIINAIFPVPAMGGRRKSRGGCGCMVPQQGGYRATKKDKKYLKMYNQGKSIGFTMRSSLKAKGLIKRANGTKRVSKKYRR